VTGNHRWADVTRGTVLQALIGARGRG
jgi:hypothetical protein